MLVVPKCIDEWCSCVREQHRRTDDSVYGVLLSTLAARLFLPSRKQRTHACSVTHSNKAGALTAATGAGSSWMVGRATSSAFESPPRSRHKSAESRHPRTGCSQRRPHLDVLAGMAVHTRARVVHAHIRVPACAGRRRASWGARSNERTWLSRRGAARQTSATVRELLIPQVFERGISGLAEMASNPPASVDALLRISNSGRRAAARRRRSAAR